MPSLTPITLAAGEEQLVNVYDGNIGGVPMQVVNARELHAYLENGDKFADWIKARIEKYGFIENQDFESFSATPEKPLGGRPAKDYWISLDMAKTRRSRSPLARRSGSCVSLGAQNPARCVSMESLFAVLDGAAAGLLRGWRVGVVRCRVVEV